ncbi:hypothetical protein SAMN05660293_05185 [Dyadobacter psychrophilus]|uniref:Uncharacterized protein n=1 Tax=Dyadobacter psychrophilus TaxID=651661 RepID=A0A1T5HAL7_9BACT|nr:hypothetical protein SAMN05660293_05185 [Dyadobacter psychrophilus]
MSDAQFKNYATVKNVLFLDKKELYEYAVDRRIFESDYITIAMLPID